MRKSWLALGALAAGSAAAAAVAWRKRQIRLAIEAELPPVDIAGPVALRAEEFLAFDEIVAKSCFGPCCVDTDEVDMIFLQGILDEDDDL